MGQDYSYTQPSSSSEDLDMCLLQAEAEVYCDEAHSSFYNVDPVQYTWEDEGDEGIPTLCYCGATPVVATSYNSNNPGRRYFSCVNADDGDCHIWKWWDVAVTEEVTELQRQVRLLKDEGFQSGEKVVKLQKTVCELKKKECARSGFALQLCVMVSVIVFIGLAVTLLTERATRK